MGTSEDKQCNIYDMASNLLEWTTETSNSSYGSGVIRGGTINDSKNCTNTRRSGTISSCANYIGFRPILYINV